MPIFGAFDKLVHPYYTPQKNRKHFTKFKSNNDLQYIFIYFVGIIDTTVCPRSCDPFYIVTYYIKWVTTSWTDGRTLIVELKYCLTKK